MPRLAMPVETPGEGDCFFKAIAYHHDKSFKGARQVRVNVAKKLAELCFGKDLPALEKTIREAAAVQEVKALEALDDPIVEAWKNSVPNASPKNGNDCPLAAWIVWLQYDVEQIAELRKKEIGCEELRAAGFLQYTLWGDTDVVGAVITRLTKYKIIVYRDSDALENTEEKKAYSIYHTTNPHHFSAVEFVDPNENEKWLAMALVDTYDEQAVSSSSPCDSKKKKSVELVLIDPKKVAEHAGQKKSTSLQYSAAPMSLPRREKAYKLCTIILEATRGAMGGKPVVSGFEEVDFKTYPDPPIFVISSNRAVWISKYFEKLFVGKLIAKGTKRAIIFMVDSAEQKTYAQQLAKRPVSVVGLSGGFGMSWNRHCALKLARNTGLTKAWIFDDNVETVAKLDDVEDALLDTYPAFSYSRRGIMEQAVGFNLKTLGKTNFCPFFPYNKDDLSLETVLRVQGFDHTLDTSSVLRGGIRKTDKTTIDADTSHKIAVNAYRTKVELALAALDIWRDENNTSVNILKLIDKTPSTPRDILKWHSDILYSILAADQKIAVALAAKWFSDAATS